MCTTQTAKRRRRMAKKSVRYKAQFVAQGIARPLAKKVKK